MTSNSSGFTLVELLVVIAIIAILSVIGITVFTGIQKSARDSKRKADIEAISKAFEVKYNKDGTYGDLDPTKSENTSLFSSKAFPKDPKGGDYAIIQNPTSSGFRICAVLEDNTSSCKGSIQAEPPPLTGGTAENFKVVTVGTASSLSCPADGLIGHWKMDGNFNDSAGNNNGVGNGAVTVTNPGKVGNAANFNGGYIDVTNYSAINGFSNITVAIWVNPSAGGRIFNRGTNDPLFYIYGNALQVYIGSQNVASASLPNTFTLNSWHHIAFTLSGGTIKTYLDGSELSSGSTGFTLGGTSTLRFGAYSNDPTVEKFSGLIDDVRIYNRVLSPDDVGLFYNNSLGCVAP